MSLQRAQYSQTSRTWVRTRTTRSHTNRALSPHTSPSLLPRLYPVPANFGTGTSDPHAHQTRPREVRCSVCGQASTTAHFALELRARRLQRRLEPHKLAFAALIAGRSLVSPSSANVCVRSGVGSTRRSAQRFVRPKFAPLTRSTPPCGPDALPSWCAHRRGTQATILPPRAPRQSAGGCTGPARRACPPQPAQRSTQQTSAAQSQL